MSALKALGVVGGLMALAIYGIGSQPSTPDPNAVTASTIQNITRIRTSLH
jgi:hypothetical protein